ncbi:alpha/beta hydrolase family protein [Novosphingobium sp.]|uniref:alpha/beta hydrolase family protein n=1 Tax=Novosphingobium sp. TaxID=1874826 RepID=UPI003B524A9E
MIGYRGWLRVAVGVCLGLTLGRPVLAAADPMAPVVAAASAVDTKARPPRISTADFSVRPLFSRPVLSPDGQHLAGRYMVNGAETLVITGLFEKGSSKVLGLPKKTDLVRYFWAGSKTLIFCIGETIPWYNDDAFATRLMAYDLDTKTMHRLDNHIAGPKGDDVLWVDPEGKTLLMAFQETVYDTPSVWSMDIAKNHSIHVLNSMPDIWDWYADGSGVTRYGFGYTDAHNWQMVYRSNATDRFKVVFKGNDDKEDGNAVDGVLRLTQGSDKGFMLARASENPYWAVYEYDFAKHVRGKLVYAAPGSDVDEATVNDNGQSLVSAQFTDDRTRVHWFDDKLAKVQSDLDAAVGADHQAWVISHSKDYSSLMVSMGSSFDPGAYYLYQQDQGVMHRIATVNEHLSPGNLAHSKYVQYKARDGRPLSGYLTLPPGRAAKGLPLIIHPHGGPFGVRDEGDFDEEVQFFANRGYAVLQPEFRGSGSFGKEFEDSAKGQWGRGMQDDLDDGMDWLAAQGTVDAKRVCVVGSSYGGYAALWAATRNPERYRCAASFAGISDVPKWLKYSGRFEGTRHRENWRAQLQGDKTFDLKTVSPLYAIDRLKVPVLIAHGDADTRVPFKQSKLYADALTAAGKPHEFYAIADEGHGFTKAANEQLWLDKLDAFLAKYNPAE